MDLSLKFRSIRKRKFTFLTNFDDVILKGVHTRRETLFRVLMKHAFQLRYSFCWRIWQVFFNNLEFLLQEFRVDFSFFFRFRDSFFTVLGCLHGAQWRVVSGVTDEGLVGVHLFVPEKGCMNRWSERSIHSPFNLIDHSRRWSRLSECLDFSHPPPNSSHPSLRPLMQPPLPNTERECTVHCRTEGSFLQAKSRHQHTPLHFPGPYWFR